jgi:hypothetical protein
MAKVKYDRGLTGLLVIDPYNDFISEGGKIGIAFGQLQKPMNRSCPQKSSHSTPHV